ncbi:MAG: PDZ domain-containing protein, partial [Tepidisphaeraceae bacterium]
QTNGIGFAMPITEEVQNRIRDIRAGREIVYGYFGVVVNTPSLRQRIDSGLLDQAGVVVDSVEVGSPADSVLQPGDMVVQINDRIVRDADDFIRITGSAPVDRATTVKVLRDKSAHVLTLTPRRRALPGDGVWAQRQRIRWRGAVFGPAPANWNAAAPEDSAGLIVYALDASSPLVREGLAVGSVVKSIAGKPVTDVISLQRVLNDTPEEMCKVRFTSPEPVHTGLSTTD